MGADSGGRLGGGAARRRRGGRRVPPWGAVHPAGAEGRGEGAEGVDSFGYVSRPSTRRGQRGRAKLAAAARRALGESGGWESRGRGG